jgi:hypothetical protein
MSFTIHPQHSERKIAEKPLPCFKPLLHPKYEKEPWMALLEKDGRMWCSPESGHRYQEGKTERIEYWEKELELLIHDGEILFGFHSYENSVKAFASRGWEDHDLVVVQFEIPVGATYYYNPSDGMYISNAIKCIGYYPLYKGLMDSLFYPFIRTKMLFA